MEKEKFYIYNKYSRSFEEQEAEKVVISKYPDFDFFVHISDDGETWNVTEAISGATVCVGYSTKDEACIDAIDKLKMTKRRDFIEMIKSKVEFYGISPKYLLKVLSC